MYKTLPSDIKQIKLDADLYRLHKQESGRSDFGMDGTATLLDDGFGLYSTANVKGDIGPIKTEYFRISLTRAGSAQFDIGLERYMPHRNYILFGVPGQLFSLRNVTADFLAYYMLFTDKFVEDAFLRLNKRQYFPFLTYSGLQCFELDEATANEIESIIFKINDEVKSRKPECAEAIRLYIQLILILANRQYGAIVRSSQEGSSPLQHLYGGYIKLVGQHFLKVRKVAEYADMLHVSADHLNRAVKSCSDKTASGLIDEMLVMESKSYLRHTTMTISEIAYQLEFADPSHFARFFKKLTSITPLEYRQQS